MFQTEYVARFMQGNREYFDPTDEGLRAAWVSLLARERWDCFATLTFNRSRRDMFEIVNAFWQ